MRGAVRSKLTGRDLDQWVTLMLPEVALQRTERGIFVPGSGEPTFREVRVKAMRAEMPGSETQDDNLQADTRRCTWTIAWRSGLTSKARVRSGDGVEWNIRGIREIPRRAFYVLDCTARPEAA